MAPTLVASPKESSSLTRKLQCYFTPQRRNFLFNRLAEIGLVALASLMSAGLLTLCIVFTLPVWLGALSAMAFGVMSYLSVAVVVLAQHTPGKPDSPDSLYLRRWQRRLLIGLAPLVAVVAMAFSALLIAVSAAVFLLFCVFPRETVLSD